MLLVVRLPVAVVSLLAVLLLRLVGRLLARRVVLVLLLPARLPLRLPLLAPAARLLPPLRLVGRLPRLHLMLVGLPRRLPVVAWSVSA